jgi:hypothetical protein
LGSRKITLQKSKFLSSCFFLIFFLSTSVNSYGATETTQTGVASPQNDSETNNIELLRQRALRNALDLALLQVTGATVSGERSDSLRTREDTTITADKADATTRQQIRHNAAGATQTKGYARLMEIVREWREKGQYYVTAKIAVDSEQEAATRQDAGHFWVQAGKPTLALTFAENLDGLSRENQDDRTLRFFRDNLIRNGIATSSEAKPRYLIELLQVVQTKELPALGTTTVHCHLSYKISDKERGTTVAEYKQSHGPDAGFSLDQAKEKCIGAVAPAVSENLVRELAGVWNQNWNNGTEQTVIIDSLPGDAVSRSNAIIQDLHRVTATTPAKYAERQFIKNVTFKGEGTELAEAIQTAFEDENWHIMVSAVQGSRIRFTWQGASQK